MEILLLIGPPTMQDVGGRDLRAVFVDSTKGL